MKNFNQLSRAEMKNVLGGVAQVSCTVTPAPGYSVSGPYTCSGVTATECQAAADKWCWGNNGCNGVDCPGAA
jgi:hypothetical protein